MAQELWHPYRIGCKTCDTNLAISELSFDINGKILMTGFCFKCGEMIDFIISWENAIAECVRIEEKANLIVQAGNDWIN